MIVGKMLNRFTGMHIIIGSLALIRSLINTYKNVKLITMHKTGCFTRRSSLLAFGMLLATYTIHISRILQYLLLQFSVCVAQAS